MTSDSGESYFIVQSPPRNNDSDARSFTPIDPADAIQVQVDLQPTPNEPVLYGHDLVMIFPCRSGGEATKPEKFSMAAFVALFMGKDLAKSGAKQQIVVDAYARVFRSSRCYLNELGTEVIKLNERDHSHQGEQRRWGAEERLLMEEYKQFVGSGEPTTETQFCELVATTVARRVQLACGLTTHMFRSVDKDEIIMTIRADDHDLRTEADRQDYPLQVSNKPFDAHLHAKKLSAVRDDIGEEEWMKARDHLMRTRGAPTDQEVPEMDPLLITEGDRFHPSMRRAMRIWGHTEEADGLFVEDDSCRPDMQGSAFVRAWHAMMEISYDPRTYFAPYADYRSEPMYQPYYRRYPVKWGEKKEETLFMQKDRIRLAASIVHRHINTEALQVAGYLVGDMFALHDKTALDELRKTWALNWTMLNQPINKLRAYFGEKIALYFAWLEFYTKMLIIPALAGIVTHLVIHLRKQVKDQPMQQGYILIVFAAIVVAWSAVFSEMWKRKNHMFNALWGMNRYHGSSQYRPQFRGTTSFNDVTDDEEMTFESKLRRRRAFLVSLIVVLMMIGIVVLALLGFFLLKYHLSIKKDILDSKHEQYRMPLTTMTTGANAVQILILNMVYHKVATTLTDWENHRTNREYENYLIVKVFLFQFCNSFASFFYIAFIKRTTESKCLPISGHPDNCMGELQTQLLMIFLIRIVVGNTTEVVIPFLKTQFQLYKERHAMEKTQKHNYIEEQAKLLPYEEAASFEDYNEMVIQFGFINLFVVAFPLTPLLALINNICEVHVDSGKLCFVHRRPFPSGARTIGAWFYILRLMAFIAMGTNCALIMWTSGLFDWDNTKKAFVFVLAFQICVMAALLIEKFVGDVPVYLDHLMSRHEHIVNIVFRNLFDGDDSQLVEIAEQLDLEIYDNEDWDDRSPHAHDQ